MNRMVYDCKECRCTHLAVEIRDPQTKKMRWAVVDCVVRYPPDPERFHPEQEAVLDLSHPLYKKA